MKTGTVKWFNPDKGFGYIHPDDGSPNVFVDKFVVGSAGMTGLKAGQTVVFEIRQDDQTGNASAASLKALESITAPLYDNLAATNPFDIISALISSAIRARANSSA
jgi:cold shock protein